MLTQHTRMLYNIIHACHGLEGHQLERPCWLCGVSHSSSPHLQPVALGTVSTAQGLAGGVVDRLTLCTLGTDEGRETYIHKRIIIYLIKKYI